MPSPACLTLRMAHHATAALAATLLAASLPAWAGPAYSAPQVFSRPGWASTQLWDIGNQGQLVGQSYNDVASEGFVYQQSVFTTIKPAGTLYSAVTGISDTGVLVGIYADGDPLAPTSHAFLYEAGVFSNFNLPGITDVLIRHISANGRYLSGTYYSTNGFAYDRQTAQVHFIQPAGYDLVIAQGVTSQGRVVGSASGSNGSFAFFFDVPTATLTPYTAGDLGARPRFRDINDSGLITGFTGTQAFVGTPGHWTFFNPAAGFTNMLGYGLNNRGDLIGFMSNANGEVQSFTASPVPEPAAWALLAGGLLLLAGRRRPA